MFLQYVIWGSWYVTLNTYLTSTLNFSGTEAGAVFGTTRSRRWCRRSSSASSPIVCLRPSG